MWRKRGGSRKGRGHAKAYEVRDSMALLRKWKRSGWLICTVMQETDGWTGQLELDHTGPCKWY